MRQALIHEHRVHNNVFMVASLSRTVTAYHISFFAPVMPMSRVLQAKGGAKSNLAKALAAGTGAAGGASGRDQRQGSLTLEVQVAAQGCATSRCLERRHCAEPRRWTFAAQRRRSRGSGSVRQRPRRTPQPRVGLVPPEQDQQVRGFQRVCGSASPWSTACGRCCGC